jgi:hypothetical protein
MAIKETDLDPEELQRAMDEASYYHPGASDDDAYDRDDELDDWLFIGDYQEQPDYPDPDPRLVDGCWVADVYGTKVTLSATSYTAALDEVRNLLVETGEDESALLPTPPSAAAEPESDPPARRRRPRRPREEDVAVDAELGAHPERFTTSEIQMWTLCYRQRQTAVQVAERLGLQPSTVRNLILRIRTKATGRGA